MSSSAAEYYNDLSCILQSSSRSSPATNASKTSSQATTPLSRDSPFTFSEASFSASESQHRRYPSTLSNDEFNHASVRSANNLNSNSNSMVAIDFTLLARNSPATVGGVKSAGHQSYQQQQHQQQQMIYQHYQQQQQQYNQQHYNAYQPPNGHYSSVQQNQQQNQAYNGGYNSTYGGTNSLYSTTGTSRSHEEDIYEDLCYVTLRYAFCLDKYTLYQKRTYFALESNLILIKNYL